MKILAMVTVIVWWTALANTMFAGIPVAA